MDDGDLANDLPVWWPYPSACAHGHARGRARSLWRSGDASASASNPARGTRLSTAGPADARNVGIRRRTMPATETSADNAPGGMKTHPLIGRGLAGGPARARRRAELEREKTS